MTRIVTSSGSPGVYWPGNGLEAWLGRAVLPGCLGATAARLAQFTQLYSGPTVDSMAPLGPAVPFLTGAFAGLFNGGPRLIPNAPPGTAAIVEVRAWEAAAGLTYEAALAAAGKVGSSGVFSVVTGGGALPIGRLTNLASFVIRAGPSTHGSVRPPPMSATLAFADVTRQSNGVFKLTLRGLADQDCVVETSTDCVRWTPLTNVTVRGDAIEVYDADAQGAVSRFYRARSVSPNVLLKGSPGR